MKVSIVISVYQSHGAVKRQQAYFRRMPLPEDVELIIVDDGSFPPIRGAAVRTDNDLAWTQGLGRNAGARVAKGEYLLMTDIDHILSKAAIDAAREFSGDRMMFRRQFGVLKRDGTLTQNEEVLEDYGWDKNRERGLDASVHLNTFAIKKTTFDALGGYDEEHSLYGYHPITRGGDDCAFNAKWNKYAAKNGITLVMGPDIYMFPVGRYHKDKVQNPKGLFHNLSYDGRERMYKGAECAI